MRFHHLDRPRQLGVIAVAALLMVIASCSSEEKSTSTTSSTTTPTTSEVSTPVMSEVWARTAIKGSNTAVYMTIAGGNEADELLSASIPADISKMVEIHETTRDTESGDGGEMGNGMGGGMMTMRKIDKLDVPAGQKVALEPGGYHVMVMEVERDLTAGESFPVTLTFKNAGEIQVEAEIREP